MDRGQTVFKKLREPCVLVSRVAFLPRESFDPNSPLLIDSLKELSICLSEINDADDLPSNLGDYVYLPISHLLKQESLGDVAIEYVFKITRMILKLFWQKSGSLDKETCKKLFMITNFLINNDPSSKEYLKKSSPYKLEGIKLLQELLRSLQKQEYHSSFFVEKPEMLSIMTHMVSICLEMLKSEPFVIDLQLQCIETLRTLYVEIIPHGETLSYILPGNISALVAVLGKPGLLSNSAVIIGCLKLYSQLLIIIYNDKDLGVKENSANNGRIINTILEQELKETPLDPFSLKLPILGTNLNTKRVHRDTSWLKGTSSQIRLSLESFLTKLCRRNDSRINHELSKLCGGLLANCKSSLCTSVPLLVRTLIYLNSNPQNILKSCINEVRNIFSEEVENLNSQLKESTEGTLSQLFFLVKLLEGDSELLPGITKCLVSLKTHVMKEIDIYDASTKKIQTIDQKSEVIMMDKWELDTAETGLLTNVIGTEEKTVASFLGALAHELPAQSKEHVIEGLLNEMDFTSLSDKITSMWISSNLLNGKLSISGSYGVAMDSLTGTGLNSYASYPTVAYQLLECAKQCYEGLEMEMEGQNGTISQEILVCTILRSITTVVETIGKDFQDEVIDYIYIIIENLASSSMLIREFSKRSAIVLAKILYHNSISDMITQNTDYIIDAVSIKLASGMTQRVSVVLMVICKLAGYEAIRSFKDVIETLFKMLDFYHGYSDLCIQFFKVFEIIVMEMQKTYLTADKNWDKIEDKASNKSTFKPWGIANVEQICKMLENEIIIDIEDGTIDINEDDALSEINNFKDYVNRKMELENSDSDDDDDDDDDIENYEDEGSHNELEEMKKKKKTSEEWVSPIPVESYRVLLQIISYGDRLLTHPSKELKILILNIFSQIWPMLATQYSSLLPQVAQAWPLISTLTFDSDYSIVEAACVCLRIMIECSGDFVSKRFVDLWKEVKARSILLKEIKYSQIENGQETTSVVVLNRIRFPPITMKALAALNYMLLEGIIIAELFLSDLDIRDMLHCCVQSIPKDEIESKSLHLGDVLFDMTI